MAVVICSPYDNEAAVMGSDSSGFQPCALHHLNRCRGWSYPQQGTVVSRSVLYDICLINGQHFLAGGLVSLRGLSRDSFVPRITSSGIRLCASYHSRRLADLFLTIANQTDRLANRLTDRLTDRQTDRRTDWQTDRQGVHDSRRNSIGTIHLALTLAYALLYLFFPL